MLAKNAKKIPLLKLDIYILFNSIFYQEIFAPKELEPVHKPLPKGASIKDYLSDKASPTKVQKQTSQSQTLSADLVSNTRRYTFPCIM